MKRFFLLTEDGMDLLKKIKKIFFDSNDEKARERVISSEILREYDIRGIYGKNLFEQDAYHVGRAFGTYMLRKKLHRVCVGWDCRVSSEELSASLIRGLVKAGAEVTSLGLCHTPLMYYATNKLAMDAGIMITGSHNPPEFNGFKITVGKDPFFGSDIKLLGKMIRQHDFEESYGREIIMNNIFIQYVTEIIEDMSFHDDLKIAWDIGNGTTSRAIKAITKAIPGKHHLINEEVDGTFPNRLPDPMTPGNLDYLAKFIVYNKFDIGFAFDSDGDRLCVVNSKGQILFSDQVLEVFARDFLKKNPAAQVIATANCSNHLFDVIRQCGGVGLMEKSGHSGIKAKMQASGALLAGEMSGHFFFKDRWYGFDDGIYAALRCLEILGENKDAFVNLEHGIITPEIRIPCDDNKKFRIIEAISKKLKDEGVNFSNIDGVRVSNDNGWWIIRASNTQGAVSVRIEADTHENMERTKVYISELLGEYIDIADML